MRLVASDMHIIFSNTVDHESCGFACDWLYKMLKVDLFYLNIAYQAMSLINSWCCECMTQGSHGNSSWKWASTVLLNDFSNEQRTQSKGPQGRRPWHISWWTCPVPCHRQMVIPQEPDGLSKEDGKVQTCKVTNPSLQINLTQRSLNSVSVWYILCDIDINCGIESVTGLTNICMYILYASSITLVKSSRC